MTSTALLKKFYLGSIAIATSLSPPLHASSINELREEIFKNHASVEEFTQKLTKEAKTMGVYTSNDEYNTLSGIFILLPEDLLLDSLLRYSKNFLPTSKVSYQYFTGYKTYTEGVDNQPNNIGHYKNLSVNSFPLNKYSAENVPSFTFNFLAKTVINPPAGLLPYFFKTNIKSIRIQLSKLYREPFLRQNGATEIDRYIAHEGWHTEIKINGFCTPFKGLNIEILDLSEYAILNPNQIINILASPQEANIETLNLRWSFPNSTPEDIKFLVEKLQKINVKTVYLGNNVTTEDYENWIAATYPEINWDFTDGTTQ